MSSNCNTCVFRGMTAEMLMDERCTKCINSGGKLYAEDAKAVAHERGIYAGISRDRAARIERWKNSVASVESTAPSSTTKNLFPAKHFALGFLLGIVVPLIVIALWNYL